MIKVLAITLVVLVAGCSFDQDEPEVCDPIEECT